LFIILFSYSIQHLAGKDAKEEQIKKGFTLIELIVVIVIVGILASTGTPGYLRVLEKTRAAEARMVLGTLRSAQVSRYLENGTYNTVDNLGVGAPTACTFTHFFRYSCSAANGRCSAVRCTANGKTPNMPVAGFGGCWGGGAYTITLDVDGTWGQIAG
jgi:prepilin-type N-terminal cleavage/methylation domain-containing protein